MTFSLQTAFKLAYSLGVALLFVLAVVMGARTVYEEPDAPVYPAYPELEVGMNCDFAVDQCTRFAGNGRGVRLTLAEARATYPEDVQVLERRFELQTEYDAAFKQFRDDQVEQSRNVLLLASIAGVVAMAAGLYLFTRVEAIPLGLLLGGLSVVIYAWVDARDEFSEIGAAPVFAATAVGFVVVLAVGYWLLRPRRAEGGG